MKTSKPSFASLTKGILGRTKAKKKKKGLKSLEIEDLRLIPQKKLLEERIGITSDNYLSFALRSENYEASKYLLSLKIFPIDFKNSSGFSYFHSCILSEKLDLLKLCFTKPENLSEPYMSKKEIEEGFEINPEIFTHKIFELTSNKGNTILN